MKNKKALILWFRNALSNYSISDVSNSLTIDELINELQQAKKVIGGNSLVAIGDDNGHYSRMTVMRMTIEEYEEIE